VITLQDNGELMSFVTRALPAGSLLPSPTSSPYILEGLNKEGTVVTSTPLLTSTINDHARIRTVLEGDLLNAGKIFEVRVQGPETTLPSRTRPEKPSTIIASVLSPRPGTAVPRGKNAVVKISGSYRSASRLDDKIVQIDIRRNKVWQPLGLVPMGKVSKEGKFSTTAQVPQDLLGDPSSCVQLRARIDNGFQEFAAVTGCIKTDGVKPTLVIRSPQPGFEFQRGANIPLSARTYAGFGQLITENSTSWKIVGRKTLLGRTTTLDTSGLPEGKTVVEVQTRDKRRFTTTARFTIVCSIGANSCRVACSESTGFPATSRACS
jgi:hypothetical protein